MEGASIWFDCGEILEHFRSNRKCDMGSVTRMSPPHAYPSKLCMSVADFPASKNQGGHTTEISNEPPASRRDG